MKAVVIGENGLEVTDVAKPEPKANEVLTKVATCGLNRADVLMASGAFHGAQGGSGTVMGMEWAGEVEAVGSDVTNVAPGDRVMCTGTAGYAEYAVSDYGRTMRIPGNNMSYEQAATLPIALHTMHNAVVTQGRLQKGESVLIQGASSGVGLMAMQIAKHMGAAKVFGTSTNDGRRAKLTEHGADMALDSSDPAWVDAVLEATGDEGVDLIVDQVSGSVANQNLAATKVLGRIVNVGRLGGGVAEFNFDLHALRRIDYIGVTFRTRSIDEIRDIVAGVERDLGPAIADGTLSIPIDRTFPLDEAPAALDYMAANNHFGKLVLQS
tara:strand:+ start:1387 stop:2358 length:972 start_codon:yes stop_codon:yes gene_type:complete